MVKRWSIKEEGLHNDTNGKWVTYEDYSALQSLNTEMLEIIKELLDYVPGDMDVVHDAWHLIRRAEEVLK